MSALAVARKQADDEALWFPETVREAVLQHALRHLAAAVEGELCPVCGKVKWQKVGQVRERG